MTHNNPEERSVEDWEREFDRRFTALDWSSKRSLIDIVGLDLLPDLKSFIHHQLQKAREEDKETFRKIVQANLDKYCIYEVGADTLLHSELDQDVSK